MEQETTTEAVAPIRPPAPRGRLARDLLILGIVGTLLVAAVAATASVLDRELYSPSAFVQRYLGLLADGRAADALALPGVSVDSVGLEAAGLPETSSDALLRSAALGTLTDITVRGETTHDDTVDVDVSYRAGGHPGTTTFSVEKAGQIGLAPTWRFAESPLAVIDVSVTGSQRFDVNGFSLDRRQLPTAGEDAPATTSLPMLVFSPGVYSVTVGTPIAESVGVAVLSDSPMTRTPIAVEAQPTAELRRVVQNELTEFLDACTTQQVMQPTGCPFGFVVQDRVAAPPTWSITTPPTIDLIARGAGWAIPTTGAVARIEVDIRSLFDGAIRHLDREVPFYLAADIDEQPDGSVSITMTDAGG